METIAKSVPVAHSSTNVAFSPVGLTESSEYVDRGLDWGLDWTSVLWWTLRFVCAATVEEDRGFVKTTSIFKANRMKNMNALPPDAPGGAGAWIL